MRVLLLHRQPFGGIANLTGWLAEALKQHGVQSSIEDASDWIPNATDLATSKKPTAKLRELGKDFDMVHAFGYRAAWACGDAFSYKEAWIYTAYGMPKTTHSLLIEKLNEAQIGICSSYSVRDELSAADALDLIVRYPGLPPDFDSKLQPAEARALLGLDLSAPIIGAIGRFVPERGFKALLSSVESAWEVLPDLHFALAGEGPEADALRELEASANKFDQIRILGRLRNPADFYRACDLIVVPSLNAGFSLTAAEAMKVGTPVLLRSEGGLSEMAEADHTAFYFRNEDELGRRIAELIKMPMMLGSVSNAGRLRAESLFQIAPYAEAIYKSYKSVLE